MTSKRQRQAPGAAPPSVAHEDAHEDEDVAHEDEDDDDAYDEWDETAEVSDEEEVASSDDEEDYEDVDEKTDRLRTAAARMGKYATRGRRLGVKEHEVFDANGKPSCVYTNPFRPYCVGTASCDDRRL
jgi:hypothetical protein